MKKLQLLIIHIIITIHSNAQDQVDCECANYWNSEATVKFVELLDSVATKANPTFWGDYYLGKGILVLEAGKTSKGKHCLGAWKNGENIGYKTIIDRPEMLTQLFTYYLNYKTSDTSLLAYTNLNKKSPEFNKWMTGLNVHSAVYMPTEFPDFPFKISAIKKIQLAVHELFHLEVQFPVWFNKKGYWPDWDHQPDRQSVNRCYTCSEEVKKNTQKEVNSLLKMIESIIIGDTSKTCIYGKQFVRIRKERYEMNDSVNIKLANDSLGNCEIAESFMELEEGLADWASWTQLFENGVISEETILKHYKTKQQSLYYPLGCMMFHAITLISKNSPQVIIEQIVNSKSINEGSIWTIFIREFDAFCNNVKKQ